jgi:hypothetical protein
VPGAELSRRDDPAWRSWGPYLAERAWGTVREDYSAPGTAWEYFPHDHARSRAYRWNEDGLGGMCDDHQRFAFAFAFWNGQDPILKERVFGLTGNEGNHGEDAKEYWWYLDSTPTHSYMRWRYLYPTQAFPYNELVAENRRRSKHDPEYELVDTGVLDGGRFFDISAEYAKASPEDYCVRLAVRNAGPEDAVLHVLPTLWFRNDWTLGYGDPRPEIVTEGGVLRATSAKCGDLVLAGDGAPVPLVCDNETNSQRLWGVPGTPYPKDGINDHVVHGAATVNPEGRGTKAALWYRLQVPAGGSAELRVRLSRPPADGSALDLGPGFERCLAERKAEADEFYAGVLPATLDPERAMVARQAFAGMLWCKQLYHYNVAHWLDGDPGQPPPPASRREGRNREWRHLNTLDVMSMPDAWEYPWFAAWDLAFHCVTLAHVDPQFAKDQLVLMAQVWMMHPNGQLPAYEWAFGDVNPPVHALAALKVFEIDGGRDFDFLERVFMKLLMNFTWWVNRKDAAGNNVFEGGFLGLDNIGPIDRSAALPVDGILEQSDGTSWMAAFCLRLWEMSLRLAENDPVYEDMAIKFAEHFTYIADAMYEQGLWDDDDGFYYDVLALSDGRRLPLRVRSLVGLIPIAATTTLGRTTIDRLPRFAANFHWFLEHQPRLSVHISHTNEINGDEGRLFSIVDPDRLRRLLSYMLDENEFLSPYGLRSVSRYHRDHPFHLGVAGVDASVDYEPGESTSGLFGGNSNWRGPVWFPINYILIQSLRSFHHYLGDDYTVEMPTGSGRHLDLGQVADELADRLVRIFLDDAQGRRPVFGPYELFQHDRSLHDGVFFHEYFHGDDGHGLGASHQTGWTGLVANLILGS